MLGMPWLIIVVHMLTIGVLALGFSGLSVGLGACMPNFREHDPSRIAVGFGGTVNLIVGLLLLATVISLVVVPVQFTYGRHDAEGSLSLTMVPTLAWLAMIVGLALGSAAIWLPMWAGMRCLREMEF